MTALPFHWRARSSPLEPVGAAATGAAARALATRLLTSTDEALAALRGVASAEIVIVLGESAALPWVDGVVYLGQDASAPALLVPTVLEPTIPIALLERAILRRSALAPLAVLPKEARLVPCGAALPLVRDRLHAIVGGR